ncbi:MAG: hypothetical protein EXQ53_02580, partial [Acidobacteria bacterium]|nr:hypothetical protein [Acidobacteriota bacterium]
MGFSGARVLGSSGSGLPLAALGYGLVTALLFRNLLPDLSTHLYSDLGDPLLNTAILAWSATHVPLTDAWWNFPSFAPLAGVTAFTEHLLLTYPIASPVVWLTGKPVLAYNIVFLLATPLNAVAAYALARELTGSRAAAFLAGLAFAYAPYQQVHLSHLQHMTSFGMPCALLWLHRYLRTGRPLALVWFGVGWLMTALANSALLVFFPVLVLLWAAWFVRPSEWRRLRGPVLAASIATLPLLPLLWGYHVRQAAYGLAREYREIQSFSADIVGVFGMYHRAVAWHGVLPHDFEEGALFPGLTIVTLALLAIISSIGRGEPQGPALRAFLRPRRLCAASAMLTAIVLARVWTGPWGWHFGPLPLPPFRPYRLFSLAALLLVAGVLRTDAFRRAWSRRDVVVFYALAVVVLWLLALGPEPEWSTPWRALAFGPYRLLIEVPGVRSIRVPARAWLPALLSLAVLAAFGAAWVLRQYPRYARTLLVAGTLLIVTEGWSYDGTMAVPGPMRREAIPAGAVVLDLPMEEGFANAVPQYRAVVGGYRTVNGYSGYQLAHVYPLRRAIADLQPDALDTYRRRDDLYVIVRPGLDPLVTRWVASLPGAEHLFDLDAAKVYRLPRRDGPPDETT